MADTAAELPFGVGPRHFARGLHIQNLSPEEQHPLLRQYLEQHRDKMDPGEREWMLGEIRALERHYPELGVVQLSRTQYLGWVSDRWPDKERILLFLAEDAASLGDERWPPVSDIACFILPAQLGLKIAQAERPDQCVEAFFEMLKYFACPEPGWDGVTLRIID